MFKYIAVFPVILFALLLKPNPSYAQLQLNLNTKVNTNPRNFNFGNWFSGSKNFFEVTYGFGTVKHKDIETDFGNSIIKEFKFGTRYLKPVANYKLIEFSDNYIFSSFIEDGQNNSTPSKKIAYDIWRFGLGYKKGFGYNFDSFAILPYYQFGFAWSNPNIAHPLANFEGASLNIINEFKLLSKYNNAIKFGTTNVGGLDIRVSSLISIGGSYETSIIFPYHLFWKQAGSFLIETLSQTGIDYLTEGVIIRAVPDVTPVIYFILKNGLSYFFYTLKQEEMNWPFNTEAPLTLESYKINIKITF